MIRLCRARFILIVLDLVFMTWTRFILIVFDLNDYASYRKKFPNMIYETWNTKCMTIYDFMNKQVFKFNFIFKLKYWCTIYLNVNQSEYLPHIEYFTQNKIDFLKFLIPINWTKYLIFFYSKSWIIYIEIGKQLRKTEQLYNICSESHVYTHIFLIIFFSYKINDIPSFQ
jgi:hypothetical protein